jgi:hypothetical protein
MHHALDFEVDQWVWLRLHHRPMASLDVKGKGKLGIKYYGPLSSTDTDSVSISNRYRYGDTTFYEKN